MMTVAELNKTIKEAKQITITTHVNPDGDALGSCLSMYLFLKKAGKENVQVITPNEYPNYFKWMPSEKEIWDYKKKKQEADEYISASDLIFCLDYNALSRVADMEQSLRNSTAFKVLIDHHQLPDTFDYMVSDIKASSTCELVYYFTKEVFPEETINKDIATCLYTGLLTDTGFYQHSLSPSVFRMAADLLEFGIDSNEIQQSINTFRAVRLRFLGNALLNRLRFLNDLNAAYITVTEQDAIQYKLSSGDTEGLVNMPLGVNNIKVSALFKESPEDKSIRISLRSKGDFSVEKIARDHFNGGGHKNAAGGKSFDTLNNTVKKFITILQQQKNV